MTAAPGASDDGSRGWDCHTHVFDGRGVLAASHYRPPVRDLAMLSREGRAIGVRHCVLVQPSVYGTDNGALMEGLRAGGGLHRGVAVVDADVSERTLADMHAQGVRGVRFNLVSPAGNDSDAFERLAPRLREIGWHVQWYVRPSHWAIVVDLHRRHRLRCVLDHVAGLSPGAADGASLRGFAGIDAWVKLSGWYRAGVRAPYDAMDPVIRMVADAFPGRCVWGSDWPHTWFLESPSRGAAPAYADEWHPVVRALGADAARRILEDVPMALYG